jgi:hypothetical protein
LLETHWQAVVSEASAKPDIEFVADVTLRKAIHDSVNHKQVAYRFCLPIQLLGKLTNAKLDCLRLQKKKGDPNDITGWDARSLGSKVVAPFNQKEENVLGTSNDPYVGNPMRIPLMVRDDRSKKDVGGWNTLVDVLEQVESGGEPGLHRGSFSAGIAGNISAAKISSFYLPTAAENQPGKCSLTCSPVFGTEIWRRSRSGSLWCTL